MHPFLKDIYNLTLDTILPIRCASCRQEAREAICPRCLGAFTQPEQQRCIACAKDSAFGLTHLRCKTKYTPERLLCVFDYKDKKVSQSIINGKYYFIKDVFRVMGLAAAELLQDEVAILDRATTLISPLPLHSMRQRWRGYNQSAIIAKTFADYWEIPYTETLIRNKYTKTQKNLKKDARHINVADCFNPHPNALVDSYTIILVDDVTTTGSTLCEAAKALKNAGASRVWCVALAHE